MSSCISHAPFSGAPSGAEQGEAVAVNSAPSPEEAVPASQLVAPSQALSHSGPPAEADPGHGLWGGHAQAGARALRHRPGHSERHRLGTGAPLGKDNEMRTHAQGGRCGGLASPLLQGGAEVGPRAFVWRIRQ